MLSVNSLLKMKVFFRCFFVALFIALMPVVGMGQSVEENFEDDIEESLDDEVENSLDDDLEEQVDDDVEEALEEDVEDQVDSDVEDALEEDVEDQVDGDVEDALEEDVEDQVDSDVEDALEEDVEDQVDSDVEEALEEDVEDQVDSDVEEALEEDVEDQVDSDVEEALEEDVEDQVDSDVEEALEEDVEDQVDSDVEEALEEDVEDQVDSDVEEALEEDVDDQVDSDVEDALEDDVEEDTDGNLEEALEDDIEEHVDDIADVHEDDLDDSAEDDIEHDDVAEREENALDEPDDESLDEEHDHGEDEQQSLQDNHLPDSSVAEALLDNTVSAWHDSLEVTLDDDGDLIAENEWVVMADAEVIESLEAQGYELSQVIELNALDAVMARVIAPESFDLEQTQVQLIEQVQVDELRVDHNHFYQLQTGGEMHQPREAIPEWPHTFASAEAAIQSIGIIDTAIDNGHRVFQACEITSQAFVPEGTRQPEEHGTAVASILCGKHDTGYQGLLPGASLYAASVFYDHPRVGKTTSVVSLIQAIDWLVQEGVQIINMSLAGPDNVLLQQSVAKASDKGVMIVAAAGNSGPVAAPLFPAAYERVIAVTAVASDTLKAYRLAGRGAHIDLAAPGVNIVHAKAGGDFHFSSGTSFATPFVSALLAIGYSPKQLFEAARDLGKPGRDTVYGYGFIQP